MKGRNTLPFIPLISLPYFITIKCGACQHHELKFRPSRQLQSLRVQRHACGDARARRASSLQIFRMHRREVRVWKASNIQRVLQASSWSSTKRLLSFFAGKQKSLQPSPDEFAEELETLFCANPPLPCRPQYLTENAWSMRELFSALRRKKVNKAADEVGLVVELLQHAPSSFLQELLRLYNHVLHTGEAPTSWRKTVFKMLAKFVKAKTITDFRPVTNVRLLYKTFACLVLGRVESVLDANQPEEQHGFRKGRRIEEHLLTVNIMLDKTVAANIPLWVSSVDFSKAFDRVSWTALWSALARTLCWTVRNCLR
ncbi:unnamed protein product [Symbiodinium sp. CCMP2592]|nr:unnamed protein product [Symbiodinium sp. CCMP2592]